MLPRFYQIIDDPSWLDRLCPQGLAFAQIRIKDKAPDEVASLVEASVQKARKYNCILVVNDHWQTAIRSGAEWVHVGQEDLDTVDLDAIRKAKIRIGISTHTEEELDRALACGPDYVALGPIFSPRGKQVAFDPQGLAPLRLWKSKLKIPLIAIGGIRLEQALDVYAAGADTICVVTDVLDAPSPEQRCSAWINLSG